MSEKKRYTFYYTRMEPVEDSFTIDAESYGEAEEAFDTHTDRMRGGVDVQFYSDEPIPKDEKQLELGT